VNVIKPVFDLFLLSRASQNEKGDGIKPVYVGEFPQVVRDEQASMLHRHVHGG
jgi:nuclear pore complex protein Nup133